MVSGRRYVAWLLVVPALLVLLAWLVTSAS